MDSVEKTFENSEELRERFLSLDTPQQLADLLEINYSELRSLIYRVPPAERYRSFLIPKRSGGTREILAPNRRLKEVQSKLNLLLQAVYFPKRKLSAHGFLPERNIVTNAELHVERKHVLNLDLREFFPSINFGRVRGMFKSTPYNLHPDIATILAQICCFNNQIPQGAPTSPIISNMICAKMDSQLQRLAKSYNCIYTRYADDLTFSTYRIQFPVALASRTQEGQVELGSQLVNVIEENGFTINQAKVRLQTRPWRQEVTGLVVNEFPNVERKYVRQIRAMLHAWEKHGYEASQEVFLRAHDPKHRTSSDNGRLYAQVVKGRIDFLGMVRGKEHPIYKRFLEQLAKLDPELTGGARRPQEPNKEEQGSEPQIAVESIMRQRDADEYAWYEDGLALMKKRLEEKLEVLGEGRRSGSDPSQDHESQRSVLQNTLDDRNLLEARLLENIRACRKHGDNENRRTGRAEIAGQLNNICTTTLNISYNELCNENTEKR
jgi:RNA-directed DNA polymerase